MSDRSTELLLAYLELIDDYQELRSSLSTQFSTGFLAIAQANFNSTTGGRGYGKDFYDGRMTALRGIEAVDGAFECRRIPPVKREEEEVGGGDPGSGEATNRGSEEQQPSVDPRDPIRWFGILSPPALRQAQSEFTQAVETTIPRILTVLSKLSSLASEIRNDNTRTSTTHLYKILPSPPPSPLPEAIPLLPLDVSSGFIHLSTAGQVASVIGRFMSDAEKLWLLKVAYSKIESHIRWEVVIPSEGEVAETFPHLYNKGLGASEVDSMKEIQRTEGREWREVLDGLDWLEK